MTVPGRPRPCGGGEGGDGLGGGGVGGGGEGGDALRPGLTGTRRRKRRLRPSARRSTRVALPQRGATGPADQITPSRAEQPRPMGTRRSGVAELTNRAHTRAE